MCVGLGSSRSFFGPQLSNPKVSVMPRSARSQNKMTCGRVIPSCAILVPLAGQHAAWVHRMHAGASAAGINRHILT
jgi:hypothetical protein